MHRQGSPARRRAGLGCGSDGVSKKDKDSAREAVETGLAAWKKGETMKPFEPPSRMEFTDDDWQPARS